MRTLNDVLAEMEAAQDEMKNLLAKARDAESDDKAKAFRAAYDAKADEFDALKGELEDLKAAKEREDLIARAKAEVEPDTSGKNYTPDDPDNGDAPQGTRAKAHNNDDQDAFQRERIFVDWFAKGFRGLSDNAAETLEPAPGSRIANIDATGEVAVVPPLMARSIASLRTPSQEEAQYMARAYQETAADPVLSTDSTGGTTDSGAANLYPSEMFVPELIQEPVHTASLVDRVRRIPAGDGKVIYPKLDQDQGTFGGVSFTWKSSEGQDKGETEPVFGSWEAETNELSGWTALSQSALRRSKIALAPFIQTLFREAARYYMDRIILHGTGTNQPEGILTASGVQTVNRQVNNEVCRTDLVRLAFAIKQGYRRNGTLGLHDDVLKFLMEQEDTTGRPLFTPDPAGGLYGRLAGFPWFDHDFEDPSDASTDLSLGDNGDALFGNFRMYGLGVESDIAIDRSDHAEFKRALTVFRLILFVGGKPMVAKAFSKLIDAAS